MLVGKVPGVALKKKSKKAVIVRDVVGQVAAGELKPGDRLASIKDLCAAYGFSQRVVCSAIEDLALQGIVVTRRRSGCYISDTALERAVQVLQEEQAVPRRAGATISGGEMERFLVPRTEHKVVSIYISDSLPANVAFWRRMLNQYCTARPGVAVEPLFVGDGHLEEVLANRHVDLVQTTPVLLEHLGRDRFAPLGLSMLGRSAEELLPLVAERVKKGPDILGAPFSVTLPYLFVNLELAEAAGIETTPPGSFSALLERVAAFRSGYAAGTSLQGLVSTGLMDLFMLAGALQYSGRRGLLFDAARARTCCQRLLDAGVNAERAADVVEAFLEGRLLYMYHCSFDVVEILERARFPWAAQPRPLDRGGAMVGDLMVLAASRNTPYPQECLDLIKFLCSVEVQRAFGRQFGNLPAWREAALDPELLADHPLGAEGLTAALAGTTLLWPGQLRLELTRRTAVDVELFSGAIAVDEAVERIRFALDTCPG